MELSMDKLGKAYNRARKAKGFTLEEASIGILSPSHLSKFERGVAGVDLNKFIQLIHRIHLDMNEFFNVYASSYELESINFMKEITEALRDSDIEVINKLAKEQQKLYDDNNNLYHHHNFIIASQYSRLLNNYESDDSLTKEIETYLIKRKKWSFYEIRLFKLMLPFFKPRNIKEMSNNLFQKIKDYYYIGILPERTYLIFETLQDAIVILLENNYTDTSKDLLKEIDYFIQDSEYITIKCMQTHLWSLYYLVEGNLEVSEEKHKACLSVCDALNLKKLKVKFKNQYNDFLNK